MPVLVGTSGWQYADWRGRFYPAGLGQPRWLAHYFAAFQTVELNVTFYRLPKPDVFVGWRARSPADAVFAVKASRYLTHVKRLRDPAEPVARLLSRAAGLGDKLGPVLVQLPPDMSADPVALDTCLACFPADTRVAVETRHPSWWTDEVAAVLTARGAAAVWADRQGAPLGPRWRTAGWGFVRLHEGPAQPWPRYDRDTLASWVARIAAAYDDAADVFVYFNNDPGCAAVTDAIDFAGLLRAVGRTPTRVPAAYPAAGSTS